MLAAMIAACLLLTAAMPFAVFAASGDIVNGAIVAGIFSVVNTLLNAWTLRRVGHVDRQVAATKTASREGNKALLELAEQHLHNGDPPPEKGPAP